jgi:aspartate carbamoyltransferase catalytic subunit
MNSGTVHWTRKDLLGLRELSVEEINLVLETADAFKQVGTREVKKVPALQGKTLINLFIEPSTRTRISFELAAKRLSADIVNISAAASSLTKRTMPTSLSSGTVRPAHRNFSPAGSRPA